jgi:hypothetical protein
MIEPAWRQHGICWQRARTFSMLDTGTTALKQTECPPGQRTLI